MKWLDKWLAKRAKHGFAMIQHDESMKAQYASEPDYSPGLASPGLSTGYANQVKSSPRTPGGYGMNFTVYPANGGHVLEYQYYDQKTDRHTNSLHLVTADQDLGQVIGHAITLEMLKR